MSSAAEVQPTEVKARATPWLEAYRPVRLSEVVGQTKAVQLLQKVLSLQSSMPHLLLHGPPGTGKTSTILALARQLYQKPEYVHSNVLELNASVERGIDVIRERVKVFAKLKVAGFEGHHCPFKLVILDEADNMTLDAQHALRRLMETTVANTRFCLMCNHLTRMTDPILSRVVTLRYEPLTPAQILGQLERVAREEKSDLKAVDLQQMAQMAQGDMRRALSWLHQAHSCQSARGHHLNMDLVLDRVPSWLIESILMSLAEGTYSSCLMAAQECVWSAYLPTEILESLMQRLMPTPLFENQVKFIAETEERLREGADPCIQLCSFFLRLCF